MLVVLLGLTTRLSVKPPILMLVQFLVGVLCVLAPTLAALSHARDSPHCSGKIIDPCDIRLEHDKSADVALTGACVTQWIVG